MRDERKWDWLDALSQDLRYSAWSLLRTPGFAALAIFSFALGIGATSAIFSIVDVALLHPLPVKEASRVVWFREFGKDRQESGGNPARLHDWQKTGSFETVSGCYSEGVVLTDSPKSIRLEGLRYIGALTEVLGARLQIGRFPTTDEIRNGAPVLVLTNPAWRKVFDSDVHVLGRPVNLSGRSYDVIGILDRDVRFPESTDFWAPAPYQVQGVGREAGFLAQAARLAPNITLQKAQAEVDTLAVHLGNDHSSTDAGRSLRLQLLADHLSESSRPSLLLFFGAGLAILLIACVNVAGLLLARGLNRQRETSVRVALGAGRSRVVRLFLSESFLLAAAGCVGGILLAAVSLNALKATLPEDTPRLADAAINVRVLLFAAVMAIVATLVSGLVPSVKAAGQAVSLGLKQGNHGSIGAAHARLRSALVSTQIALSLVLLIASGLLLSSFVHIRQKPLGFNPRQAFSFTVVYPWDTPGAIVNAKVQQVLDRLSQAPGVRVAGVVDRLPLHGGSQSRPIIVEGVRLSGEDRERQIGWRMSSKGFFPAAGVSVVSGTLFRAFRQGDPRECVISRQLAAKIFAGRDLSALELPPGPGWVKNQSGFKSQAWWRTPSSMPLTQIQLRKFTFLGVPTTGQY